MTKYGAFLQVGVLPRYFNSPGQPAPFASWLALESYLPARCWRIFRPPPPLPSLDAPLTCPVAQAVDRDAPPEWRGKFFRYKALKKALKECSSCSSPRACHADTSASDSPQRGAENEPPAAAAAQPPAGGQAGDEATSGASEAEVFFFELLKSELLRVNRCAEWVAADERQLAARGQGW